MSATRTIRPLVYACCLFGLLLAWPACTSVKSYSIRYYRHNKGTLDSIINTYRQLTVGKPLSVGFTDQRLNHLSFELFRDNLRTIKEFTISDTAAIEQTLRTYHYPVSRAVKLLTTMRRIHAHWISTDSYYIPYHDTTYLQGNYTFISIKPTSFHAPFSSRRYYVLVYMQPGFVRDSLTRNLIYKSGLSQLAPGVFYRISDRFR